MEERIYNNVGNVLQLNKTGELIQKRMKAVKVCDGLYVTEPDKSGYMQFICELNGVVWLDCKAAENRIADGIKLMPGYFDKIKAGCFDGENIQEFKREISRRINHPDSPAIMELKQPERKKVVPLAENERKVSVLMFKGCTDETTEKKVAITEVAPHVYTYAYKMRRYGERVKIIFEIDGVYFQGADNGAYIMEREDFNEICAKAYEHARENVADGAAKGMRYFVEVQKRIDAATPPELAQTADTDAAITLPNEDINYMFYIKPKGAKRFSTYNPGKGTMDTGRVFTELYRKEHLPAVCKWIAEDKSGDFAYQLRSGDGKRIFWEHNPTAATATKTPQIPTETEEAGNVSAVEGKAAETAKYSNRIGADENASQSPETPQAAECIADTPKPREMAQKEPKQVIRNSRTTQQRTIKRFLIVQSVPRLAKCSTAHYIAGASKMVYSGIIPSGYAPPIRGDCKLSISTRAKPPNRARSDRISNYKPP